MYIFMMLCLSEEYVCVKHARVSNMMDEGMSMFRFQGYENGNYVKGVLTSTRTYIINK